ncbi:aspartyl/asparaginyl beta-hydroxylase domain-containing protein [Acidovorax sp. NCPPB 3576]|uniref:aspartyl/asparaginyl beta-hydroxylase domain-containing protein n=1 Tax=Acidovorax sp. NCPPB 3576 TaxID=2940488 RepID=UPI00234BE9D4|nr:aspartyl/asparaginyl beta-hydroxylase domain-containing protein [Acidovorax sp. NCPPB 3576]WCM87541.1 aspartyl/asparaginyl beta-hydroxylase domain-containing protein [Acidovorax sp. NCPPB 3576]
MIATVLAGLAGGWLVAMAYVYRLRGRARYASVQQYWRKSWPVFALPNAVLYLFTRRWARGPFVPVDRYAQLAQLAQHWETLRDEALAMQAHGGFDEARRQGSPASFDVGFRTFYKYGWSRYYLHWYGYTYPSAIASCPRTLEILSRFPDIRAAMFAVLPPRSGLTPHADPLGCSLRYHLGLATPNAAQCFINVDGVERAWRDGEAFVFDETYLHFVTNDTDAPRLILMCDVRRPMALPGRVFNAAYSLLARAVQTPNDARDRRGVASALFAALAPVRARGKQLRERNRPLYNALKWGINLALLGAVFGIAAGALASVQWLLPA